MIEWTFAKSLGSGAFGTVEWWRNKNQNIAIKKCHVNKKILTSKQRDRWINEVFIMNKLNHPNIIKTKKLPEQFKNYNVDNDLPILCMEFCTNGDLRSVLNRSENIGGLPGKEALKIMRDISQAVEYLHGEKITHRDLKPENIVLQQVGNKVIYKLIDLGYAKELSDASIAASVVGTLSYLAPELLWKESYSCSVDYWSLGILFYEIITGARPFLPHMQITKAWMDLISKKNYNDISAREVNNKIVFSQNFDVPSTIPECIRDDLIEWFRLVLQWDPRRRGKVKEDLVVFSKLKEILNKKIIQVFVVPSYKFESYIVDPEITVDNLKILIFNKEKIDMDSQILTDSLGNILNDQTLGRNEIIMVFRNDLHLNQVFDPELGSCINEALVQPRRKFNYCQTKSYYAAIIFYIKNQIEIYRTFILALSIMIDYCDKKIKIVSRDIENLSSGVEKLASEIKTTGELIKNKESFEELRGKVVKFLEQKKKMENKFDVLVKDCGKLREFVEINWMEGIEEPLDQAWHSVNILLIADRNISHSPFGMVQVLFKFLKVRKEKLADHRLTYFQNEIMQFLKQLSQLTEVLKSFHALLNDYNENLNQLKPEETEMSCKAGPAGTDILNTPISETDAVIYNSIFMSNMLGSLLTEMESLKSKYADLTESDE